MVVSNVQGMSNGPQYAENDSGRAHQVVSVEATPAAQSNVSSVPLFDESQIRRFQEIYNPSTLALSRESAVGTTRNGATTDSKTLVFGAR